MEKVNRIRGAEKSLAVIENETEEFLTINILRVYSKQHLPLFQQRQKLMGVAGTHSLRASRWKIQVLGEPVEGSRVLLEDFPVKELFWTGQPKFLQVNAITKQTR